MLLLLHRSGEKHPKGKQTKILYKWKSKYKKKKRISKENKKEEEKKHENECLLENFPIRGSKHPVAKLLLSIY